MMARVLESGDNDLWSPWYWWLSRGCDDGLGGEISFHKGGELAPESSLPMEVSLGFGLNCNRSWS